MKAVKNNPSTAMVRAFLSDGYRSNQVRMPLGGGPLSTTFINVARRAPKYLYSKSSGKVRIFPTYSTPSGKVGNGPLYCIAFGSKLYFLMNRPSDL